MLKQVIITDSCQRVVRTDPGIWTGPNSASGSRNPTETPALVFVRSRTLRREVLTFKIGSCHFGVCGDTKKNHMK